MNYCECLVRSNFSLRVITVYNDYKGHELLSLFLLVVVNVAELRPSDLVTGQNPKLRIVSHPINTGSRMTTMHMVFDLLFTIHSLFKCEILVYEDYICKRVGKFKFESSTQGVCLPPLREGTITTTLRVKFLP